MSRARSLVFAACSLAALAVPAFSAAETDSTGHDTAAQPQPQQPQTNAPACDCSQCAGQHQHIASTGATRARRHRHAQQATMATMHIDSSVSREVADGCRYTANARGQYRGAFLGTAPQGKIRDVHVTGDATLSCNGHVVRHQTQRWDLPSMRRGELTQAMHDRLAIEVPGSSCAFSSNYAFHGGDLAVRSADSSCSRGEETAALENFERPTARAVAPSARGGGQREPTSQDARIGTR
jgi:hypothetical protein